jgi:hypothetical protein
MDGCRAFLDGAVRWARGERAERASSVIGRRDATQATSHTLAALDPGRVQRHGVTASAGRVQARDGQLAIPSASHKSIVLLVWCRIPAEPVTRAATRPALPPQQPQPQPCPGVINTRRWSTVDSR